MLLFGSLPPSAEAVPGGKEPANAITKPLYILVLTEKNLRVFLQPAPDSISLSYRTVSADPAVARGSAPEITGSCLGKAVAGSGVRGVRRGVW